MNEWAAYNELTGFSDMFRRHTKKEALDAVRDLVSQFRRNLRQYKSEDYLEANVRSEFIEKLLKALNWDVDNENGVAPNYKEVVFEARASGADDKVNHPDYALCIGGKPVLYVEAKPPSVKVLKADKYALQLRRYAYSQDRMLSVLTDFEEFAVYDARKRPDDDDTADVARVKYITFDRYESEFDYLWDTFSYNAVVRGSIENYFNREDGNYSRNDVNDEMLGVVEDWRRTMAGIIRSKGGRITEDNFNFAVQRLVNEFVKVWREKGY